MHVKDSKTEASVAMILDRERTIEEKEKSGFDTCIFYIMFIKLEKTNDVLYFEFNFDTIHSTHHNFVTRSRLYNGKMIQG